MCRLLERDHRYPAQLTRVRSYLNAMRARPDLNPLDRTLLGLNGGGDILAGFDHHTAPRKRLQLDVIAYVAGARDTLPPTTANGTNGASHLHVWKRTEMLAFRVIGEHAAGHTVDDSDLATLADWSSPGPGWQEGVHLTHLLCLHALSPFPGYAEIIRHGLDRLVSTQLDDGGFTVSDHFDTWTTSIVATALSESGADPILLDRIADWLLKYQDSDGGWSYQPSSSQTDMDTTYTALAFLARHAPHRCARQVAAARAYVRQLHNSDGGWPTYRRGNPSEPAMSGGALAVLASPHAESREEFGDEIIRGAAWLAASIRADGTFERGWSLAEGNAIFRAVHGLVAARETGHLPPSVASSVDSALHRTAAALTDTQNGDGSWGHRAGHTGDPISTGYALAALGRLRHRQPVTAALTYLAKQQRPDGGFTAPPDTTAPRPIPVDVPLLASAYVLRGLAYCQD